MRSESLINVRFFGRTVEGKSFQNRVRFFLLNVVVLRVRDIAVQRSYRPQRKSQKEGVQMRKSAFKRYDDLPLFLNAELVAQVLGVSPASAYELLHEDGFPTLRIGNRMVVPKEKFIQWVEEHTKGGDRS